MKPSGLWTLLLTLCTSQDAREAVLGDFHEEYADRAAVSRSDADAWYRRQVARSVPALLFADRGTRARSPWRTAGAMVLGTIVAFGCIICGQLTEVPFRSTLFAYGALGFPDIFWWNVAVIIAATFVAGWVTSMLVRRSNLEVGLTLASIWWVLAIVALVLRPSQSMTGDWIVLAGGTLGALAGVACRVAWLTRALRAAQ